MIHIHMYHITRRWIETRIKDTYNESQFKKKKIHTKNRAVYKTFFVYFLILYSSFLRFFLNLQWHDSCGSCKNGGIKEVFHVREREYMQDSCDRGPAVVGHARGGWFSFSSRGPYRPAPWPAPSPSIVGLHWTPLMKFVHSDIFSFEY